MGLRIGKDCVVKYGTAGTEAATVMNDVVDVNLNLGSKTTDATTRSTGGWEAEQKVLRNATVDITIARLTTPNAGYDALMASYLGTTPVLSLLIMDGSGTDSQGLDADFEVMDVSRPEPIADGVKVTFTCKPTSSTRNPAWKDVSS